MCDLIEHTNDAERPIETAGELRAYLQGLDHVQHEHGGFKGLLIRRATHASITDESLEDEDCLCPVDIGATLERYMVAYRYDPTDFPAHFHLMPERNAP